MENQVEIAVLQTKVDALIEKQKELTARVRANEKVVAAVTLLGTVVLAVIGAGYFAPPAEACSPPRDPNGNMLPFTCPPHDGGMVNKYSRDGDVSFFNNDPYPGMLPESAANAQQIINKLRDWEREQKRTNPEFDINRALAEYFNGSDDPTESEELLQLQSDSDRQSIGWRYD